MGTRTTVVDVTEDMELVDCQPLDNITDSDDKVVGTPSGDDCIDNDTYISSFVAV